MLRQAVQNSVFPLNSCFYILQDRQGHEPRVRSGLLTYACPYTHHVYGFLDFQEYVRIFQIFLEILFLRFSF
jgi:hypothetical protein